MSVTDQRKAAAVAALGWEGHMDIIVMILALIGFLYVASQVIESHWFKVLTGDRTHNQRTCKRCWPER